MDKSTENSEASITVVTHNADFHADDICAVATLAHLFGGLEKIKIVRSRDAAVIDSGDYVVDVGGVYDQVLKRFDHHQVGGAGVRENGIPYAAFGLVWKEHGERIASMHGATNPKKVAQMIEQKIVVPLDADDNGFSINSPVVPGVVNYRFQEFLYSSKPTWQERQTRKNTQGLGDANIVDENNSLDPIFIDMVKIAYETIAREIKIAKDLVEVESLVSKIYEATEDKRLIILDNDYPWKSFLDTKTEPLFVVYPSGDVWRAKAVSKNKFSFENRKDFPASWGGLYDEELTKVSGVSGAIFCHRALFTVSARSKEGAIRMARIAIDTD